MSELDCDSPDEPQDEINWARLTFKDLEACWKRLEDEQAPSPYERALTCRYENIIEMIDSDRIWPPTANSKKLLGPALSEVLSRLPDDDFYMADEHISFVVEDPQLSPLAFNVPCTVVCYTQGNERKKKRIAYDQIVFFHRCWQLTPKALIALVAHEIAHTFVSGAEDSEDEDLTNKKVMAWGFEEEYLVLQKEKAAALTANETRPLAE